MPRLARGPCYNIPWTACVTIFLEHPVLQYSLGGLCYNIPRQPVARSGKMPSVTIFLGQPVLQYSRSASCQDWQEARISIFTDSMVNFVSFSSRGCCQGWQEACVTIFPAGLLPGLARGRLLQYSSDGLCYNIPGRPLARTGRKPAFQFLPTVL